LARTRTAIEVLAANEVEVCVELNGYVPTPVLSHAILTYNKNRQTGPADGIVITPSHNPPDDGGFKYNPPHGGPAGAEVTNAIEKRANALLNVHNSEVKRMPFAQAVRATHVRRFDFVAPYVATLGQAIDLQAVGERKLRIGVDPLGGAAVAYWPAIAERYRLDLRVVNEAVDATFRFMTVDKDGKIRMDCSSPYAMAGLIGLKDQFDAKLDSAPHNQTPIGGLKVVTENGWFAARPSGTENVYKIYAESFLGADHLARIQQEARAIVEKAIKN
jgi:phosphoglucomutase